MDITFGNAQVASTCIYEGLLNRMTEEERNELFTSVKAVKVETIPQGGRSAVSGSYGVKNSLPTVVYEMSEEALAKWAPLLDGMTNRVPGTVTIVQLKLRLSEGVAVLL